MKIKYGFWFWMLVLLFVLGFALLIKILITGTPK